MSQILPPKKDVALALLERASVFVHLDPRGAGVVVPMHFKKQPRLVLQIGLNMQVPIPDLRLDDQGLSCTLSFNRSLFHCVVPWSGIFALVGEDGRGMVWPEDVPQEIAREMSPQKDDGKTDGASTSTGAAPGASAGGLTSMAGGKKRPHVSLVASGGVRADAKRPSKRAGTAKRKQGDPDKPTLFKVESPESPSKAQKSGKPAKRPDEKRADGKGSLPASPSKPAAVVEGKPAQPGGSSSSPSAAGATTTPSNPSIPAGSPSSSPPGKRSPKRELPPYLRVVK